MTQLASELEESKRLCGILQGKNQRMCEILRSHNVDVEKLEIGQEMESSPYLEPRVSGRLLPSIQEEESGVLDSGRSSLFPQIQGGSMVEMELHMQIVADF